MTQSIRFEFATAQRIVFGAGTVRQLGDIARGLGKRALVVTGRNFQRAEPVILGLRKAGIDTLLCSVTEEPTLEVIEQGTLTARESGCDFVAGCGGGSALDAAKAISAMMTNKGSLLDYVEVIGRGIALQSPAAPCLAIPTTAGTGAEATRNAVLASPELRVKVSLRSPFMMPRVALVDPELALDLPRPITAATGLDALTQLMEAYVSCRANPMTDALSLQGIRLAIQALPVVCGNGRDLSARTDMALASLLSGIALANAGLGAVHGFAGPVGGSFHAPHGAVCAALLPHVMSANITALGKRDPGSGALQRYTEIARLLTGQSSASAADGVKRVADLLKELEMPGLTAYGVVEQDADEMVEKAVKASSMKGNPIALTREELRSAFVAAL